MFMYSDYSQHLLDHVKKIHFIGCGGSGTYPLIQILHSRGFAITGSDVEETKNTEAERALGVRVAIGHDAANLGNPDLVVYSAAIHNDNPELQAAHARGIKAVERSVMLGYISRTHSQSVGVAGTHGKTTTTGMITTMLELAGKDPAAVIGGKLPLIGGYGKQTMQAANHLAPDIHAAQDKRMILQVGGRRHPAQQTRQLEGAAHELQFATGGKLGTHRNDVYRLARAVHGKQSGKDFAILRFVKHFGAQLPAYKHHSGTFGETSA